MRLHTSDLKPNPDEVGEVFTVPLQYLLDMEPTVGHLDIGTKPLKDFPFHLLEDTTLTGKLDKTTPFISILIKQYTPYGANWASTEELFRYI